MGLFDTHVHASPDVVDRIGDDLDLAAAYHAAGADGFVLKAHYESTVGRAAAVTHEGAVTAYGGIALNHHVGGINPSAVAATLAAGGRVVWLPTADAHTQQAAGLPRLCDQDPRLPASTYAVPPVDPAARASVELVLTLVAEHDAVLATGHLSEAECHWLAERAAHLGVTRLLFTHPSYIVPDIDPAGVRALVATGGFAEITAYQLLHQPGCTPALLAEVARAAGPRLVLASDAGQADSPNPPQALATLIDVLAGEGLDRGWLSDAASATPQALFAPR